MVYETRDPEPAGHFPMVYETHKPEPTSHHFPKFTKGQTWVRDSASGLPDLVFDLKILYVTYDQKTELAF